MKALRTQETWRAKLQPPFVIHTSREAASGPPCMSGLSKGSPQAVAGRERKLQELSCTTLSTHSDPRMLCTSSEPSSGRLCPVPGSFAQSQDPMHARGPQHGRAMSTRYIHSGFHSLPTNSRESFWGLQSFS